MQQPVQLGPKPLTREDVHAVARGDARVEITEAAREAVTTARAHIERLATAEQPTYGVSTGFGALAVRHIPPDRRAALQQSLVRSHAAGSGPEVEREVVRALMLLRLSTLATGARVSGRATAYPGTDFEGIVSTVGSRIDPSTRTLTVRADFPNPDHRLRPGMLVEVRLPALPAGTGGPCPPCPARDGTVPGDVRRRPKECSG